MSWALTCLWSYPYYDPIHFACMHGRPNIPIIYYKGKSKKGFMLSVANPLAVKPLSVNETSEIQVPFKRIGSINPVHKDQNSVHKQYICWLATM